MTRYLITGGAGFIGSHLAEVSVAQGQQVTVLDNFYSGKRENLTPALRGAGQLTFIEGDIHDLDTSAARPGPTWTTCCNRRRGQTCSAPSSRTPWNHTGVNLTGTANLLGGSQEDAGVCRFVSASSSSVYGDRENGAEPKHEYMDRPKSPLSCQ